MSMSDHLKEGKIVPEIVGEMISADESRGINGAVAVFLGQVRADQVDDKSVTGIEYSAYTGMIDPVVGEIIGQLKQSHPEVISVKILHSTGWVAAGEHSMVVIVTSVHRKQAFAALEESVNLIKERLPVWKKEFFSDGSFRWVEPGH